MSTCARSTIHASTENIVYLYYRPLESIFWIAHQVRVYYKVLLGCMLTSLLVLHWTASVLLVWPKKKSVFLAYCNYRDYLLKMIHERLRHKAVLHKQKCHISDVVNSLNLLLFYV